MPDPTPFHKLIATATPPDLGPGPRPGVQALAPLQKALDDALKSASIPSSRQNALRALVLLWHDHHDPAHELVQDGATADDSYIHGILHRREPDYGNARYWFHRVGRHAAFAELAKPVQSLLQTRGESVLETRLFPRGQWDAFAFIEACDEALGRGGSAADRDVLQEIQRIEFATLLEHLAR